MRSLRVISADSAAAILGEKFVPLQLVASVSVLVEPPYREPCSRLAKPIFKEVSNDYEVVVNEAMLCSSLLERIDADIVHLDLSLGGISIEELSPIELSKMRLSNQTRHNLLRVLPKLRKIAGDIKRSRGLDVLAIGKESIPVRIAELTAGAEAILYACAQVLKEKKVVLLGLPTKCQHVITGKRVYLNSLMVAEHDVRGFAEDTFGVLKQVNISETLNPVVRGFRILKISPTE